MHVINNLSANLRRALITRLVSCSRPILLSIILSVLIFPATLPGEETDFELLSIEQGALFSFTDDEIEKLEPFFYAQDKSINAGPKIILHKPLSSGQLLKNRPVIRGISPIDLHLEFIKTNELVDMSTLKVVVRKFFLILDLTPELEPYIEGNTLKAEEYVIPDGKYIFFVEISDQIGNNSAAEYLVSGTEVVF